jgi:hypothetical protein
MNELSLSGNPVIALDLGADRNGEIIELFPGRAVYRYQFDPVRGHGKLELYGIQQPDPDARYSFIETKEE